MLNKCPIVLFEFSFVFQAKIWSYMIKNSDGWLHMTVPAHELKPSRSASHAWWFRQTATVFRSRIAMGSSQCMLYQAFQEVLLCHHRFFWPLCLIFPNGACSRYTRLSLILSALYCALQLYSIIYSLRHTWTQFSSKLRKRRRFSWDCNFFFFHPKLDFSFFLTVGHYNT